MAILKCKMCGGDMEITPGASIAECIYCGTQQTILKTEDEGLQNLFNRANILRMKSEFDKAADIYEKILQKNDCEAEAYWGLILCKYGIEYVEDPVTFKRVPTCHRASYDAVTADEDYKNALKYADFIQKKVYEDEAAAIEEIQKGIIALAQKADPYDVFICYKETDESGKRTQDSVIANDIYHQLTQEGFKVFYAAISLEDKLGKEYEPYIFSALTTSKVMLSLGTKPEYFNAVWVKNEWSRFLKIMKKDRSKLLIPCYKDMDPYELPEEFAHLQAQDMSKIGFINDLVRGIKKVVVKEKPKAVPSENNTAMPVYTSNVEALLKRGNMALEDGEWNKADGFFEEVLNQNAECSEAYIGKLLVENKATTWLNYVIAQRQKYKDAKGIKISGCSKDKKHIEAIAEKYAVKGYFERQEIEALYNGITSNITSHISERTEQLRLQTQEIERSKNLGRARQYAKGEWKEQLERDIDSIFQALNERIEQAKSDEMRLKKEAEERYQAKIKETDDTVIRKHEEACARLEADYQKLIERKRQAETSFSFEDIRSAFLRLNGYKDSTALADECQRASERIKEEKRKEDERHAHEQKIAAEKKAKKQRKIGVIVAAVAVIGIGSYFTATKMIIPANNYKAAEKLFTDEQYDLAAEKYTDLGAYKDASVMAGYSTAKNYVVQQEYKKAVDLITDSSRQFSSEQQEDIMSMIYSDAESSFAGEAYTDALAVYSVIPTYSESADRITECKYQEATSLFEDEKYESAVTKFKALKEYKDSKDYVKKCEEQIIINKYQIAKEEYNAGNYKKAFDIYTELGDYEDAESRLWDAKTQWISNAEIGEIVTWGTYEQDNNNDTVDEPVEWIVTDIDRKTGNRLLIARQILDTHAYDSHDNYTGNWMESEIRAWMNDLFCDRLFSETEKEWLSQSSDGDLVFLPSATQAQKIPEGYFHNMIDGHPTKYAETTKKAYSIWWLKDCYKGKHSFYNRCAQSVYFGDLILASGDHVNDQEVDDENNGVRPAIWFKGSVDVSNINNDSINIRCLSAEIGDVIQFGGYDGFNNWLIIEQDGSKRLILCMNSVTDYPFVQSLYKATWPDSDVRQWLNTTFVDEFFNEPEQRIMTTVEHFYSDDKRTDTISDKIFLLSEEEAEEYVLTNEYWKMLEDMDEEHKWWLRDTDSGLYGVSVVNSKGKIAGEINNRIASVRPAMWIDLRTTGLISDEELSTIDVVSSGTTYTASAEGMGTVTVSIVVVDDKIISVNADVSEEASEIGGAAGKELESQAMAAQSAEIDGVSGATWTSDAFKTALADCINQAGL